MKSGRSNKFSRALEHLKSTTIDEKLQLQLLSEIPTNNTQGIYTDEPERTETSTLNPNLNPLDLTQDDSAQNGRDTTGLFMPDGTILTEEPPGDTSYILGPMAAMYYTWDYPWTQIGYIRQSDRRMVNLGRIDGKLSDWDGSEGTGGFGTGTFVSYGQLTLEQAVWFRNVQKQTGATNDPSTYNYYAFYPGPPSQTPDQFGRYPSAITGISKNRTVTNTQKPTHKSIDDISKDRPYEPLERQGAPSDPIGELILLGISRVVAGALLKAILSAGSAAALSRAKRLARDAKNWWNKGRNVQVPDEANASWRTLIKNDYNQMGKFLTREAKLKLKQNPNYQLKNRDFTGGPIPRNLEQLKDFLVGRGGATWSFTRGSGTGPTPLGRQVFERSVTSLIDNPITAATAAATATTAAGRPARGQIEKEYLDKSGNMDTNKMVDLLRNNPDEFVRQIQRALNEPGKQPAKQEVDPKVSAEIDSLLKKGLTTRPGTTKSINNNRKLWNLSKKLPPGDPRIGQILNRIIYDKEGSKNSKLKFPPNKYVNPSDRYDLTKEIPGWFKNPSTNNYLLQSYEMNGNFIAEEVGDDIIDALEDALKETETLGDFMKVLDAVIAKIEQRESELKKQTSKLKKQTSEEVSPRKKLIREIKKPYKVKEVKQEKLKGYRPKTFGKLHTQYDKLMQKAENPAPFKQMDETVWTKNDKYYNERLSQERKNEVLDHLGTGDHYWDLICETGKKSREKGLKEKYGDYTLVRKEQLAGDTLLFFVDENGKKESILQSEYSDRIARQIEEPLWEQETLNAPNDPLIKRIKNKLATQIDYPDKPSPMGYPDGATPQQVAGWHPEYGKRAAYYNALDPQSADAMPLTGDSEIDAKVNSQKTPVLKRVSAIRKKKGKPNS
tara:strand:- start:21 stop:2699 length:2679 start_codon:yes stop_codon:yes gene_type:complete